jgi:hypothetical protein
MKRAVFLNSLAVVCVASTVVALGQSDASRVCPFSISGLWRSDIATEGPRIFFSFSAKGHVTMLSYSPDTLPQDFEVITSVGYKLDKPAAPKQIEFTAWRGDDVFQKGVTSWQIVQYGDDSFTTLDPVSGQQTRWVREQTHRYFLTFAGRSGALSDSTLAFAMWTVMNGRQTKTEALGIQMTKGETGKVAPTFGPISAELYDRTIAESEKDETNRKQETIVIVRLELTEAEFEKTHQTHQIWKKLVTTHKLPHVDPYLNVMEFLTRAAEGINQCGDKAKMNRPTRFERDEIVAKLDPPKQPLEYVRITRKKNEELHVTNSMYPWVWRPLIQQPED